MSSAGMRIPTLRDPRIHVVKKGAVALGLSLAHSFGGAHGWVGEWKDSEVLEDRDFIAAVQRWWDWLPRSKQVR